MTSSTVTQIPNKSMISACGSLNALSPNKQHVRSLKGLMISKPAKLHVCSAKGMMSMLTGKQHVLFSVKHDDQADWRAACTVFCMLQGTRRLTRMMYCFLQGMMIILTDIQDVCLLKDMMNMPSMLTGKPHRGLLTAWWSW